MSIYPPFNKIVEESFRSRGLDPKLFRARFRYPREESGNITGETICLIERKKDPSSPWKTSELVIQAKAKVNKTAGDLFSKHKGRIHAYKRAIQDAALMDPTTFGRKNPR